MKLCARCRILQPVENFYRGSTASDRRHSYCKTCFMAANRRWVQSNPEKVRASVLRRRYGITEKSVQEMLEHQEHKCAICMRAIEFLRTGHVDHDHKTGRVRGILCGSCNRALGLLQDDAFIISEAAAYLQNHAELVAMAARDA